jgi:hypothetical protein
MAVTRRDPDALFSARTKKPIPFDFVLDELAELEPWTRPMFGCTAVYVEERIVFVLRDGKKDADDGVWVATTKDHHGSLRRELPNLRSITVLGVGETAWQVLPVGAADFEESVLRACALVRAGDPRIGKVPKAKKAKKPAPADHKAEVRRRVAQKRGRRSRP